MTIEKRRFALLQIRRPEDPILERERTAFATALECDPTQIESWNVTQHVPTTTSLRDHALVLIGGSGDYSVLGKEAWLPRIFDLMRELYTQRKPTFGSCWGFQAMAMALGGTVVRDPALAELGTPDAHLTPDGKRDSLWGRLADPFPVLCGHEDSVIVLPNHAVSLVTTGTAAHQAFRFDDAPILVTQFHAELSLAAYLERVEAYPRYVREITGLTPEAFCRQCREPTATRFILRDFARGILARDQ